MGEATLLYVGNLPKTMDLHSFHVILSPGISTALAFMKPEGKSYGFAMFQSKESAERALKQFPKSILIDNKFLLYQIVSPQGKSIAAAWDFSPKEAQLFFEDVEQNIVVVRKLLRQSETAVDEGSIMEEVDARVSDIIFTLKIALYMVQTLHREMSAHDPSERDVIPPTDEATKSGSVAIDVEHQSLLCSRTTRQRHTSTETSAAQYAEYVCHNIEFSCDGFSVDSGPIRRFDDRRNAPFLESIKKYECPRELESADKRMHTQLIISTKHESCSESHLRHSSLCSSTSATATPEDNLAAASIAPSMCPLAEESRHYTYVHVWLADDTHMVAHLNDHQTVNDICAFIDAARPGSCTVYHLHTVENPPRLLTDMSQTIEQAGLRNVLIIQKW